MAGDFCEGGDRGDRVSSAFFCNGAATAEIDTLFLHCALPISAGDDRGGGVHHRYLLAALGEIAAGIGRLPVSGGVEERAAKPGALVNGVCRGLRVSAAVVGTGGSTDHTRPAFLP